MVGIQCGAYQRIKARTWICGRSALKCACLCLSYELTERQFLAAKHFYVTPTHFIRFVWSLVILLVSENKISATRSLFPGVPRIWEQSLTVVYSIVRSQFQRCNEHRPKHGTGLRQWGQLPVTWVSLYSLSTESGKFRKCLRICYSKSVVSRACSMYCL